MLASGARCYTGAMRRASGTRSAGRLPSSWWRRWGRWLGLGTLWSLLVCYPNPLLLVQNVGRYLRLPIDPAVAATLPSTRDPAAIEPAVEALLPYDFDWRVYGVPWCVPTPAEAIRARRGDCEARAVVLASLLRARGIPFTVRASLSHLWIDYPAREARPGERTEDSWWERDARGWRPRWSGLLQLREAARAQKRALWDVMPLPRKALLLAGWIAIAAIAWRRRRAARAAASTASPPAVRFATE